MKALKDVKDKDDLEVIKKAMQELSDAIQKVGAAMYQQAGPAAGTPGADAGAQSGTDASDDKKEEGPVDADFKEVPKDEGK